MTQPNLTSILTGPLSSNAPSAVLYYHADGQATAARSSFPIVLSNTANEDVLQCGTAEQSLVEKGREEMGIRWLHTTSTARPAWSKSDFRSENKDSSGRGLRWHPHLLNGTLISCGARDMC